MDFTIRKQLIDKFRPIAKHIKIKYPNCNFWGLNDICSFMAFDYEYFKFKQECQKKGIECKDERNINSINFQKDFLDLELTPEEYNFYKNCNDDNLKTIFKKAFEVV